MPTFSTKRQLGRLSRQRQRRLRKRQLKSEFALLQTLSRLFHLVCFVKCWPKCSWSWILKDCIKVQEKKKKVVVLCSRPRQNVNLSTFTLQSCNNGKEMYQKAWCTCKVVVLPISPIHFFVVLVAVASCSQTAKKCTRKAWCTCKVASVLLIWGHCFFCRSRCGCLSCLITEVVYLR